MTQRVTVIDDSSDLLAVIGDALRQAGYDVALLDQAASMGEIEVSDPDLLVIDLKLGENSLAGWDIIRLVRKHRSLLELPVIVCSAALDQIRAHAKEIENDPSTHLLTKPFSLEDLETVVFAALAGDRDNARNGSAAATSGEGA